MFIDEAGITVQGGNGGSGKVAFFINKRGPCGGNGGKGGNIYFITTSNSMDLKKYTKTTSFKAEDGQMGDSNNRVGRGGHNLYLSVPINTTIIDTQTNKEIINTPGVKEIFMTVYSAISNFCKLDWFTLSLVEGLVLSTSISLSINSI